MCCPYIPPRAFLSQRRADFAPKLRPSFSACGSELCHSENSPARTDGPLSSGRVAGDGGTRLSPLCAGPVPSHRKRAHSSPPPPLPRAHPHTTHSAGIRAVTCPDRLLGDGAREGRILPPELRDRTDPAAHEGLQRTRQLPRHHAVFRGEFPVFLTQDPDRYEPLVTFNFLDPGTSVRSPFPTHLEWYSGLFARLKLFNFVYVGAEQSNFATAEAELTKRVRTSPPNPIQKLIRYFQLRELEDTKQYSKISLTDLDFIAQAKKIFAGQPFDSLYHRWRKDEIGDSEISQELNHHYGGKHVNFDTFLLAQDPPPLRAELLVLPPVERNGLMKSRLRGFYGLRYAPLRCIQLNLQPLRLVAFISWRRQRPCVGRERPPTSRVAPGQLCSIAASSRAAFLHAGLAATFAKPPTKNLIKLRGLEDTKQYSKIARADRDLIREATKTFIGEPFESLYQRWKKNEIWDAEIGEELDQRYGGKLEGGGREADPTAPSYPSLVSLASTV